MRRTWKGWRLGAALAAAMAAAGCADPAFLDAAAGYSATTEAAAVTYADVSTRYEAAQRSERYDAAARSGDAILVNRSACLPSAVEGADLSGCVVGTQAGPGADFEPLGGSGERGNLDALVASLGSYAAAIGGLAEGAEMDEAAFREAAAGLEGSLAQLAGAAAAAAPGVAFPQGVPGAVAALVAEAGSLWLESGRIETLKEIVVEADPAVQSASGILRTAHSVMIGGAASQTYETEVQPALTRVQRARGRAGTPSGQAELRAALADLDAAVAAHRTTVAADLRAHRAFESLAEAHAAMAEAARTEDAAAYRRAFERLGEAGEALSEPLGGLFAGVTG